MPGAHLNPALSEQPRSEVRKCQILDAAEDCFRNHGFHGASIALISKTAGMSAGHIYHYFENKEAIIAAIVEREKDQLLRMTAELRAADDMLAALLDSIERSVAEDLDPKAASLKLEIIAEAARNPKVAELLDTAGKLCMSSLTEVFRDLRHQQDRPIDEEELVLHTEFIAVMFEGLSIRAIRNRNSDPKAIARMFRRVIRSMLTNAL
ncbi:MAG: TetR/AcrR family transcriptional regulator [Rhodocyclaceae bacterium]